MALEIANLLNFGTYLVKRVYPVLKSSQSAQLSMFFYMLFGYYAPIFHFIIIIEHIKPGVNRAYLS